MALTLSLAHLFAVFLILLISMAWGGRILERLGIQTESHLESVLFAAGLAFGCLEVVLFGLSALGWLRFGPALALLAVMAASAGRGWRRLWEHAKCLCLGAIESLRAAPDRVMAILIVIFLTFSALMAMAPLTGSDAMHYHFTTSLLEQGKPHVPIPWLIPSYFTGQGHLLISLGLALGSDSISLGLIFLGGLLSAAALFAVSRQMMPLRGAWTGVLIFLATPIVFWQASTSGSPDIWMAFYVAIAALAAARGLAPHADRWLVLAGFLAGCAAGVKYTGWTIPTGLILYILLVTPSWKAAITSGVAALLGGIWPILRNWIWTGDPFFPFLTPWIAPHSLNSYALNFILTDTHASGFGRGIWHLLAFPFGLVLKGNLYGLGQYFGPIVLALAPLVFLVRWDMPLARVSAVLWASVFFSVLFTSQSARFLLPVYGLSLALVLSGLKALADRGWKAAMAASWATIALFVAFSGVSDALYARDFLPVALGLEKKQAFLERMAPDYQTTEFINRTLAGINQEGGAGNVMVFYRHMYYLRVPFVDGSPDYSWIMDPAKIATPEQMAALLRKLRVRWVVKAPDYPGPFENVFSLLEAERKLTPIASTNVEVFLGAGRMYHLKETVPVVLLKVNDGT